MYGVKVEYFYYNGTFNVPSNGYVSIHNTRADALEAAAELRRDVSRSNYLNYGEYSWPTYSVRKMSEKAVARFMEDCYPAC